MPHIVRAVMEGAGVEEYKEVLFTRAGVEGATGGGSETLRSDYFIQLALTAVSGGNYVKTDKQGTPSKDADHC